MLPSTNTYDINERLFVAIQTGNYESVLKSLMEGARATKISVSCGRTAIGQAALLGETEILELLLQSCEEPELDIFHKSACSINITDMEIDTTPDDMDKLEWDDEFNCECTNDDSCDCNDSDDCTSLYFYYAKTFERTGHILIHMEENNLAAGAGERGGGGGGAAAGLMGGNSKRSLVQDPHTVDALSMAPIHYAAACGHVETLSILIEHGAQVDVATSEGVTPLHAATQSEEAVRLLLSHKANPNRKTFSTGELPLHVALRHRNKPVINQLLLSTVNINEPDNLEQTPLMLAIAHELDDIAIRLIDMGAKLNLEDTYENTALYLAVTQNNVKIASYLLAKGARLMISHYLLHHCVKHNFIRMAELLIENGENLNVRDIFGNTATLLAIMFKNIDMLECLLKAAAVQRLRGKIVDRTEAGLLTAVQYAPTSVQFRDIARLLLAYDEVNLNHIDIGSSALSCCTPFCATPISRAIMLYKMDIAEVLIKEGADITQICREHVVNTLRLGLQREFVTLAILLVHAGFKFPALPLGSGLKNGWRSHRVELEMKMSQLTWTPLTLQSLTRIKIRQYLLNQLENSTIGKKIKATKEQSAIGQMIQLLDIPKPLQTFLDEFDDLPSVGFFINSEYMN